MSKKARKRIQNMCAYDKYTDMLDKIFGNDVKDSA